MQIEIDRLVRAKRRTVALIVERDGSLTVRAPKRTTLGEIESFVREKSEWIQRVRAKLMSILPTPKKRYVNGESFLFLGQRYELKIVQPQRPTLKFDNGFTLGSTAQKRGEQAFIRWYKDQAFKIISERTSEFARQHGFTPKRIKITSAKTRWGSCSPDGTLNFTWRLIMAPMEVVDYVILHELAHLRIKNHSRRFWGLVEKLDPAYKVKRKWLRLHGETLNL